MMLVSPKRQAMWMESQHCSKTAINLPGPSQQAKKLLEDLRASCSSSNKSVQVEALNCWGAWINNQNQDDWKLNTVCYTAVMPLLTKKLQPLQKDVDICKLRFSLMWALLRKVQNIMQLEGPEYILEVFLQSCLNWLSSCEGDGGKEITDLIFQTSLSEPRCRFIMDSVWVVEDEWLPVGLLLALFSKGESVNTSDKEMFESLSTDIFKIGKVFSHLADKFLNVFVYWKKVQDKNIVLKLWRHFLARCEASSEHIAVPVWHKVFKLVGQICSEKSQPVKERFGMLHGCATTLRSVLSSRKFLDCGNSLMTPCEALFKKLVELCCSECEEFYDTEMFVQGLETSKVLSMESVAICGYGPAIDLLNLLDEFSHKSLYWGVWCGLVHCYESLLLNIDRTHFTKVQMNFYRKLRGVAVNFELDKNYLGEECIVQVERHVRALNVCLCACRSSRGAETQKCETEVQTEKITMKALDGSLESIRIIDPYDNGAFKQLLPKVVCDVSSGRFSVRNRAKWPQPGFININIDLVKRILKTVGASCVKSLLNGSFPFRFISLRTCDANINPKDFSVLLMSPQNRGAIVRTLQANAYENVTYSKAVTYSEKKLGSEDEVKRVPKTRSRKRAEEEEKRKEIENQRRKTRKSFEIRVQEIVQKNKERKTEKSCRKSPVISLRENGKKHEGGKAERLERKLRKRNKIEKSPKLEKYFKVITKKSGNDKKEESVKGRGKKEMEEVNWKQRSFVTTVSQGRETLGEGVRTGSSKEKKVSSGRVKTKVMESSPLSKLSPFKEVFHDHEYARMEPQHLRALERVVVNKESEKKTEKVKKMKKMIDVPEKEKNEEVKTPKTKRAFKNVREGIRKSKRLASETVEPPEPNLHKVHEAKRTLENTADVKIVSEELKKSKVIVLIDLEPETQKVKVEKSFETETKELTSPESFSHVKDVAAGAAPGSGRSESPSKIKNSEYQFVKCSPEEKNLYEVASVEAQTLESLPQESGVGGAAVEDLDDPREEPECRIVSPIELDEAEECSESDSTPRRGKKRFRILDSPKPVKKLKPEDPQEKLALEVEKENLKEVSPTKEEKNSKVSPKAMNGMNSSRALRMIALVPESTRSQVHWETSPKVEVKKKGPNVDKNSRASKMLALLSENILREVVEPEKIMIGEVKSSGDLTSDSLVRTPTSSLKSPKTVKQRRSIRFDDTKNETVVYETDTPPSQVLEGKEGFRRIKFSEAKSPIHSIP